jgi:hypothetical protein
MKGRTMIQYVALTDEVDRLMQCKLKFFKNKSGSYPFSYRHEFFSAPHEDFILHIDQDYKEVFDKR